MKVLLMITIIVFSNFAYSKTRVCEIEIDFKKLKKTVSFKKVKSNGIVEERKIYKDKAFGCSLKYFDEETGLSLQCFDLKSSQFPLNYIQSDRSGLKETPSYIGVDFKITSGEKRIRVKCK